MLPERVTVSRIRIIGAGCPACQRLEADVRRWVAQHAPGTPVERVDDLVEILHYRLLALPGLVVDDHVVLTGYHPWHQLDQVLRAALEAA
jgi:hypothetical protein